MARTGTRVALKIKAATNIARRGRYPGRDGVRSYYEGLMAALPDLGIGIRQQHVTDSHIVLEVLICGTHLGPWRGLPATGWRVEIPLCAVYTFEVATLKHQVTIGGSFLIASEAG